MSSKPAVQAKVSPEFTARLNRLDPRQKLRAIVVLRREAGATPRGRRASQAERRVRLQEIAEATAPLLAEIDRVLALHQGERLASKADALGCVPVATTPEGIHALADSDHVQAILEDQPVSLLGSGTGG